MTPNRDFKVTGYLKVEYLANGARVFRLDALAKALSVIATATWLAGGWVVGCLSQPVLYQND